MIQCWIYLINLWFDETDGKSHIDFVSFGKSSVIF